MTSSPTGDRLISDPSSTNPAIADLRRRLDEFYASTKTYLAFQGTEQRDALYDVLQPLVDDAARRRPEGTCGILELGAGRTGYPDFLQQHGNRAQFDAQDVTPANLDHLQPRSRQVHIGDISAIQGKGEYDLILSTYVLEHISNPGEFLREVDRLLAPGGWHVIQCPRYDFPGYLCPSLRHLGTLDRLKMHARLAGSRLMSRLDRRPRFWVNLDPSMFHLPWYRDADAVHIVSRHDIERWHRSRGYEVRRIKLPAASLRLWILGRLLTASLICRKPA